MTNEDLLHFIEMEYQKLRLGGLGGEKSHEYAMMNAYAKVYAAEQSAQADTLPRCEISSECYFGQDGCCLRGGECR